MAFSTPVFNLVMDMWLPGNSPFLGPPDVANIAVQAYYNSREYDAAFWYFKARTPVDLAGPGWTLHPIGAGPQIVEVPSGSGKYYAVVNLAWVHRGFSNEYWMLGLEACDSTGTATRLESLP